MTEAKATIFTYFMNYSYYYGYGYFAVKKEACIHLC